MSLHIHRIGLSLWLTLATEVLENHLAVSCNRVAEELAEAVDSYVRQAKLGYYPALDYLRENQLVDTELLDATDNISWLTGNLIQEELQRRLRGIFSTVTVDAIHPQSHLMVAVRPHQPNALHQLTYHYMANRIKLDIEVSLIQKGEQSGVEELARKMVARNLGPSFKAVEITSSHLIS